MNKWWFRLYTLSYLKTMGKLTGGIIALNFLLLMVDSPFANICLLLSLVPFGYLIITNSIGSFRSNIEFHKMSIPYPKLKRALYTDIFIKITTALICAGVILFATLSFTSINVGSALNTFIFFTPTQFAFYVVSYFIGNFYILSLNKDRKYKAMDQSKSFWKFVVRATVGTFVGGLFMAAMLFSGFSTIMIVAIGGLSMSAGLLYFHSRAIFNQLPQVSRFRDSLKYVTGGAVVCMSLYLGFIFIGRNEVFNENYNGLQRSSSFIFSGPFAPMIDKETFVAIEKYMDFESYSTFYSKVDFQVESLGLDYFLDQGSNERLRAYITYGKPTPEFMTRLYDHFEENKQYWDDKPSSIFFKVWAFNQYPVKKGLPEQYVASLNEATKVVASEKAERKRRREIASKKMKQLSR